MEQDRGGDSSSERGYTDPQGQVIRNDTARRCTVTPNTFTQSIAHRWILIRANVAVLLKLYLEQPLLSTSGLGSMGGASVARGVKGDGAKPSSMGSSSAG